MPGGLSETHPLHVVVSIPEQLFELQDGCGEITIRQEDNYPELNRHINVFTRIFDTTFCFSWRVECEVLFVQEISGWETYYVGSPAISDCSVCVTEGEAQGNHSNVMKVLAMCIRMAVCHEQRRFIPSSFD
jgi:hypothetical protein